MVTGGEGRAPRVGARRRTARRVVLAVVLVGLALTGWLGYQALGVQRELTTAQSDLVGARAAVADGRLDAASATVGSAATHTAAARSRAHGILWRATAHLPFLGRPLESVSTLTEVADELTRGAITPVVEVSASLDLASLRGDDGRLDLGALQRAAPAVHAAALRSSELTEQTRDVPRVRWVPPVDRARSDLLDQLGQLGEALTTADRALTLVPPMLGAQGPRRYFVGFQTNAEARGTGGLVGAFGILTADDGGVGFTRMGSNDDLVSGAEPGIDLGPDFAARYAPFGSTRAWYNSNLTAHFPYAAEIWMSLWEQQTGERLDGAVAVDPVALGYVLAATGPITLPGGEVVDGNNVVRLTESEVYSRFAEDNTARLQFQQEVAGAVAVRVLGAGAASLPDLLSRLGRAVDERRLAVWSSRPGEQAVLERTALADTVSDTVGPYAQLVVNNAAGNKMDYYLHRALTYTAADCGGTRGSAVTATLTNTAPADGGFPPYVGGVNGSLPAGFQLGTNRSLVSLYATTGAELVSVTLDGAPTRVQVSVERGHPVYTLQLDLAPGAARTLVFTLLEPSAAGAAVVPVQPLVQGMDVRTDVPVCGDR